MNNLIYIAMTSFSSGSVFFFLVSTLGIWLRDNGISKSTIGLSAITTTPYALKFLFSFIIQRYRSPVQVLTDRLKNRPREKRTHKLTNRFTDRSRERCKKNHLNTNLNTKTETVKQINQIYWGVFSQLMIIICFIAMQIFLSNELTPEFNSHNTYGHQINSYNFHIIQLINNEYKLFIIMGVCTLLSSFAVIEDITIESQRIDFTDKTIFGSSISITYLTFRMGMMASGALTLFLVELFSWNYALLFMSATVFIGMIGMIGMGQRNTAQRNAKQAKMKKHEDVETTANELKNNEDTHQNTNQNISQYKNQDTIQSTNQYTNTSQNINHQHVDYQSSYTLQKIFLNGKIFLIIFAYKICDSAIHSVSNIFFLEKLYSKIEIALLGKIWWICIAIVSGIISTRIINKKGILYSLQIGTLGQIASSIMFLTQSMFGKNMLLMLCTYTVDSMVSSICTIASLSYRTAAVKMLSAHDHKTTTHVSILGSFSSISRILVTILAFYISTQFSWNFLFMTTTLTSIFLIFLLQKYKQHMQEIEKCV